MRTLSILLPFRGNVSHLEATLVSLLENRPAIGGVPAEIVVALGDDYDDPYDLAGEVTFVDARGNASWADRANRGLERCQGAIVHVLACGVETFSGWTDAIQAPFDDPQVAAVSPLVFDRLDHARLVSAGLRYHRGGRVTTVASPAQLEQVTAPSPLAGFYRRTALQRLGGFPSLAGDGLSTVDLALRTAALGYKTVVEPNCTLVVSPDALPPVSRGFRAGQEAQRLYLRHHSAKSGRLSLATHLMAMLVETVAALPRPSAVAQLLGRFSVRGERAALQAAAQRLVERGHEAPAAGGHSTQELLHMHRPRVTSRMAG